MAAAFVQSASVAGTTVASSTTAVVSLPIAVTSSNLIVAWVRATLADIVSFTDDKSNVYTVAHDTGNARVYYLQNITNGPITFTLTVSPASTALAIIVHEVSGIRVTAPLDGHTGQIQTDPGTGVDAVSSGAIAPVSHGEYIFGASYDPTATHATPFYTAGTTFFTKREERGDAVSTINIVSEDRIQTTASSISVRFTFTSATDDPNTILVTFVPAVASAFLISKSDSVAITESQTLYFTLSEVETVTVTDGVSVRITPLRPTTSDAPVVSEAAFLVSSISLSLSASDTPAATDGVTILFSTLAPTVNDGVAVTDAVLVVFAQVTLAPIVNDSVVMLDVVGVASFQNVYPTVFEAVNVGGGFATLGWNANAEPDIAGYKIYQGTTSGIYTVVYDVGNVLTYTVAGLTMGTTYYFAITAYDISLNESGFSAEVSKTPTDVLPGAITITLGSLSTNDATAVTDSPKMDLLAQPKILESPVTMTEGLALMFPFNAVKPFDTTALTENTALTFTTQLGLFISRSDTAAITESVNVNFGGIFAANDATAMTDAVKLLLLSTINVNDATGVTDATTAQVVLAGSFSVADSVLVADAATVKMNKILLNVNNSVAMSENRRIRRGVTVGGALNEIT